MICILKQLLLKHNFFDDHDKLTNWTKLSYIIFSLNLFCIDFFTFENDFTTDRNQLL